MHAVWCSFITAVRCPHRAVVRSSRRRKRMLHSSRIAAQHSCCVWATHTPMLPCTPSYVIPLVATPPATHAHPYARLTVRHNGCSSLRQPCAAKTPIPHVLHHGLCWPPLSPWTQLSPPRSCCVLYRRDLAPHGVTHRPSRPSQAARLCSHVCMSRTSPRASISCVRVARWVAPHQKPLPPCRRSCLPTIGAKWRVVVARALAMVRVPAHRLKCRRS